MNDGTDGLGDEGFPLLDDRERVLGHEVELDEGEGEGKSWAIGDYALGDRKVTSLSELSEGYWIAKAGCTEHRAVENVDVGGHAGFPEAGKEEFFLEVLGRVLQNSGENMKCIGHIRPMGLTRLLQSLRFLFLVECDVSLAKAGY